MSGPPAQPPAGSSAPEAGADQVQEESKAEGGDCDDEADEVMGCGLFESETEDGPQPLAKPVALHSPPAKAYPDLVSAASPRAPRLPPGSAPSPDADQRLAPPPKSRLTPPAPSPMGKEKKKAAPAVEIFKSMRVLKRRTEKPAAPTPALMTAVERLHMLIALQSFEGWWELDEALLQTVHVSGASIDSSAGKYGAGRAPEASRVLATALAIAFLENTHSSDRDAWELVADKARLWLDGAVAAEGDRRDVEALAASLIAAGTKAAGPPVGIL
ncbi:MAG: hypothetical protein M1832_005474 [Thelocarpon impressellum]|nr:MAG: hypothetical protein M1832_005474 [Thelocarpon impressellum]